MRPYTLDTAEADLHDAVLRDDEAAIAGLSDVIDNLAKPQAAVSLHAAALYYASVGLRVFPLQPGAKVPFKGSSGCKDATSDPEQVTAWWTEHPAANIGVATGHLVDVVDIDGPEGVRSYVDLVDYLPTVYGTVSTPRPGGSHLYIAADPDHVNRAKMLPGLDFRGAGGYVVAPPSVNSDGVAYYWRTPLTLPAVVSEVA